MCEEGNPAKSDKVNQMINQVKKYEVRQQGEASKVRRSLQVDEFFQPMKLLRMSNDFQITQK